MNSRSYADAKFKRKDQITNLQSLYSVVKVNNETIDINPLTLFLRLISLVERLPEYEISSYFEYEMTPYPMSLFKDGSLRISTKSKLRAHLLSDITPCERNEQLQTFTVMDGGALLWLCDWKKGEKFSKIFSKYEKICNGLGVNAIVFDGYDQESTKDSTRSNRSKTSSATVDIVSDSCCLSDRSTFLANYSNRSSFVEKLRQRLFENGLTVHQAPSDADTTIVKTALRAEEMNPSIRRLVVLAEDTDILCLPIHHFKEPPQNFEILLQNVRLGSDDTKTTRAMKKRLQYSLTDLLAVIDNVTKEFIRFGHAFTGCDCTSAIYNFRKALIFEKLAKSQPLRALARVFYDEGASVQSIGEATIQIFTLIFSSSTTAESIAQIRRRKYEEMVSSTRKNIDPSCMPPTPRAAFFHG